MLPKHLKAMLERMAQSPGHIAVRAAMLTSFRPPLRKSQTTFSESTLQRSDFVFYEWGMVIKLRRSKTIQFSERELPIPVLN